MAETTIAAIVEGKWYGMNKKMTIEETINGLQSMIQSKKFIEHDFNGVVDEDVCERAIELLKEQEAVKPHLDVDE